MVDQVSYRSIRDQLVSITVDIEDKSKVCNLLERNIEKERQQLAAADASVREEYERILAVRRLCSVQHIFEFCLLAMNNEYLPSFHTVRDANAQANFWAANSPDAGRKTNICTSLVLHHISITELHDLPLI